MLLTEECAQAEVPRSPAERQKFIAAQEKSWMSLSWDRKLYTSDQAKTAITLLSAIGFSDFRDPIDLSHLSDEAASSSLDGRSSGDGVSLQQPESPSTNSQQHQQQQSSSQQHQLQQQNKQSHHGPTTGESRRRLTGNKRPASDSNMNTSSNNGTGVISSNPNHQSNNNTTTNNNTNNNNNNNNNLNNNNNNINKPPKKPRRPKQPTSVSNTASIPRGAQVACCDKSSPDTSDMWVLGRFDQYIPEIKKYEVLDYDGGEQRYRVTRHNLRVIPKRPPNFDMSKPVLAVYPKTTVFYKARLVARRGKNNWAVEFDDEDDYDSDKIKEIDGRLILQDVSLSWLFFELERGFSYCYCVLVMQPWKEKRLVMLSVFVLCACVIVSCVCV